MNDRLLLRAAAGAGGAGPASRSSPHLPGIDFGRDALLLDVDGTLLDIAPTPQLVHVPAKLPATLASLQNRLDGALALVSGRGLESLDRFLAPLRVAAIGCHGAQLRASGSGPIKERVPPLPQALLDALADVPKLEPRVRVENKTYTVAFHYRGAHNREEPLLRLLHHRLAPFGTSVTLMRGKSVVEVKPTGFNKGEAIAVLMQWAPFLGRKPVYAGDDRTDEDAFARLPQLGGIGVSVGRRMVNAEFTVAGPRQIRQWLSHLAER